jgi:purine-nucleoside phosphorylase
LGRFAKTEFGRSTLPRSCIIFGGVYVPLRARVVGKHFDSWTRPRGNWIKYTYASKGKREYLVCFNVYGGTTTLELLHLLKDGNVRSAFFVGSMGSDSLKVGQMVVPDRVVDMAGIVAVDSPGDAVVKVERGSLAEIEQSLGRLGIPFIRGKTASVPAVLHAIESIKRYLSDNKDVLGVELELSTFHHFGQKLGLKTYGLLYVWDNPRHDIISGPKSIWRARMKALDSATAVVLAVLSQFPTTRTPRHLIHT